MNTSENKNQIHDTTKINERSTPTGFRRRTMAGSLLAMALTASAVGFAAISHADDDTPAPGTDTAITAPAPAAPPPPPEAAPPPPPAAPPLVPWLGGLLDWAFHPHMHCGYRMSQDKFRCGYY